MIPSVRLLFRLQISVPDVTFLALNYRYESMLQRGWIRAYNLSMLSMPLSAKIRP